MFLGIKSLRTDRITHTKITLRERKQNLNEKNKSFENAYGVDVIDNVHDCTCYKRFALPPQRRGSHRETGYHEQSGGRRILFCLRFYDAQSRCSETVQLCSDNGLHPLSQASSVRTHYSLQVGRIGKRTRSSLFCLVSK